MDGAAGPPLKLVWQTSAAQGLLQDVGHQFLGLEMLPPDLDATQFGVPPSRPSSLVDFQSPFHVGVVRKRPPLDVANNDDILALRQFVGIFPHEYRN